MSSFKRIGKSRQLNHAPIPAGVIKVISKKDSLKRVALEESNKAKRIPKPKGEYDLINVEHVKSKSVEMGILAKRINNLNIRINENEDRIFFEEDKLLLTYMKLYTDIQHKNRDLDLAGAEEGFKELQETVDAIFSFLFEIDNCKNNCRKKIMIGLNQIV